MTISAREVCRTYRSFYHNGRICDVSVILTGPFWKIDMLIKASLALKRLIIRRYRLKSEKLVAGCLSYFFDSI